MAAKRTSTATGMNEGWTAEERAAMRQRDEELKAARRRSGKVAGADLEAEVLAKIAEMAPKDRAMAERVHALIRVTAPNLSPRLWYGMPAYALDGSVLCHFQDARKFKTRYATLGFSDKANLDDGSMWPVAFALMDLTPATEAKIVELVRAAAHPRD